MDALKESGFQKITMKSVFVLSPGYEHLPGGLKIVYAKLRLLLEGNYDVKIPAPNREVEARILRPLRSELPALRYLECHERTKKRLVTHASIGRSVGI